MRARFEREARAIAALQHPHICAIFDIGQQGDVPYLVLEYIEGETLASRLARGPIGSTEARAIALDIAQALRSAHDVGIVHRDLKPANVMLTSAGAKLLDFGLAKSAMVPRHPASAAETVAMPAITAQGSLVGTLQYMAPEQLEGREADTRTDIWALGCILYEMFAGQRLFNAPRGRQLAIKPAYIGRLTLRCLEADPAERPQTMREVVDALAGRPRVTRLVWPTAAGAGALLAVLAVFIFLRARPAPEPSGRAPRTILVADFRNTTGERIFDGVIERAISVALETSPWITVYARSDALRAAAQVGNGATLDEAVARLVARREAIPSLVTGSIARGPSGYALSAALIDTVSGAPAALVTETGLSKADVLSAVAKLSNQLRTHIGDVVPTTPGDLAVETFTTSSLDAAKAYTTGQDLASAQKFEESISYYQDAVRIDPEFGRAYSGWASALDRLGRAEEAAELFRKAISLLSRMNRHERLRTEGIFASTATQDWAHALEIYQTLATEYPGDMIGLNNLAVAEFQNLHFDRAFTQGRRVVELWPNYVTGRTNLALYAMYTGAFDLSTQQARAAIALNDRAPQAYIPLGVEAAIRGRDVESLQWYEALAGAGARGAWLSELAKADLDAARGRWRDAERRLLTRVAEDERSTNTLAVANAYAFLAEIAASQQRASDVFKFTTLGGRALSSPPFAYRFALALIDVGWTNEARRFADGILKENRSRGERFALPLNVELNSKGRNRGAEIIRAAEAVGTWWAYYRAATVLGRENAPEAAEAVAWCREHQSQATAAFLDDVPTVRLYVAAPNGVGKSQ